jgi:hypothetical protein
VTRSRPAGVLLGALLCGLGGCGRDSTLPPGAARATATSVRELSPAPGALALPVRDGSVRFAVIGDSGRGDAAQHAVARQMLAWRAKFPFEFVLMLGDNIYGPHTPDDYVRKFEAPYEPLLAAGVSFHAAIGNHDDPAQIYYSPFHMGGQRYYTFRKGERTAAGLTGAGVRFFALDSRSFDPAQLAWLRSALAESGSTWKICFFHHPIYTSGRYAGTAAALREALEPIVVTGDVDVVFSGHEHVYERVTPQRGVSYFVSGAAGSLRRGDLDGRSPITARGFDQDYHFLIIEVTGTELYFQAISRGGQTVDAGVISKEAS